MNYVSGADLNSHITQYFFPEYFAVNGLWRSQTNIIIKITVIDLNKI